MRILVVDDSLMSCGVLVRMLASLFPDADTQYVTGGKLALEFLAKNKTDIVLTDQDIYLMYAPNMGYCMTRDVCPAGFDLFIENLRNKRM